MKRRPVALLLSPLLLPLAATPGPVDARHAASPDKALAGRVPGKPTTCIPQTMVDDTQVFDSGSILYRMKGGPDYLNTPSPRCFALRGDRGFVTSTPSTFLCRGDIMRIVDFVSGFDYGSCPLGDFVPYARPKKVR